MLFSQRVSYSTLNVARSAVSQLVSLGEDNTVGSSALCKLFFRGVFRSRPPMPRYSSTWDVGLVLDHLRELGPPDNLNLRSLTLKTVMLMALLSAQRCQTLHLIEVQNICFSSSSMTLTVPAHLKHSRPGFQNPVLHFNSFEEDPSLCIVASTRTYLHKTSKLRSTESTRLFLSFIKPFGPVSRDTIRRWVRTVMTSAGVDTRTFKAHSVRSASTSAAAEAGIPLADILATAGWSSERTFDKFYHRHLPGPRESSSSAKFATAVLKPAGQPWPR